MSKLSPMSLLALSAFCLTATSGCLDFQLEASRPLEKGATPQETYARAVETAVSEYAVAKLEGEIASDLSFPRTRLTDERGRRMLVALQREMFTRIGRQAVVMRMELAGSGTYFATLFRSSDRGWDCADEKGIHRIGKNGAPDLTATLSFLAQARQDRIVSHAILEGDTSSL